MQACRARLGCTGALPGTRALQGLSLQMVADVSLGGSSATAAPFTPGPSRVAYLPSAVVHACSPRGLDRLIHCPSHHLQTRHPHCPMHVPQALALECMRAARQQERGCYVFAFSGPQEVRELELNMDAASLDNLLSFLEKVGGWRGCGVGTIGRLGTYTSAKLRSLLG